VEPHSFYGVTDLADDEAADEMDEDYMDEEIGAVDYDSKIEKMNEILVLM
jgi:hypothetical protein